MYNNQFVNNWLFDDPINGYSMMMDGCTVILNLVFGGGYQRTMLYPGFYAGGSKQSLVGPLYLCNR